MIYITKLVIKNFKQFENFEIQFNKDLNIIVGNNDAGKTTIIEAINLVVTGVLNGRYVKNEISEYLFNNNTVQTYLQNVKNNFSTELPKIEIDLFLNSDEENISELKGKNNLLREDACGVSYIICFDEECYQLYSTLLNSLKNKNEVLNSLPLEYYHCIWKTFADGNINPRTFPLRTSIIDSSTIRYRNGSDIYISKIINDTLSPTQNMNLNQAYRSLKDKFISDDSVLDINANIKNLYQPTNKDLSISANMSVVNSWEDILVTCYDDVPFQQIGQGEQSLVKTALSLAKAKNKNYSKIVLIEEPENHLSHTKLKELLNIIQTSTQNRQKIITTHNSFVANKLNLKNLIFLNERRTMTFESINEQTQKFFEKMYTYDTLRMILANKVIFVEGPSDELIVQKTFKIKHKKLADDFGIDIISVIRSAPRFLEIAKLLNKKIAVITDNDGDYNKNIEIRYQEYKDNPNIKIFSSQKNNLNTLEPCFLNANFNNLETIKNIVTSSNTVQADFPSLNTYLQNHKSDWSLKIFETTEDVNMPDYIENAIEWILK